MDSHQQLQNKASKVVRFTIGIVAVSVTLVSTFGFDSGLFYPSPALLESNIVSETPLNPLSAYLISAHVAAIYILVSVFIMSIISAFYWRILKMYIFGMYNPVTVPDFKDLKVVDDDETKKHIRNKILNSNNNVLNYLNKEYQDAQLLFMIALFTSFYAAFFFSTLHTANPVFTIMAYISPVILSTNFSLKVFSLNPLDMHSNIQNALDSLWSEFERVPEKNVEILKIIASNVIYFHILGVALLLLGIVISFLGLDSTGIL